VSLLAFINDGLTHPPPNPRLPCLVILIASERIIAIFNHIPILILRGQLNVNQLVEPFQVRRNDRVVSLVDLIEKLAQGQSIALGVVEGNEDFPESEEVIFLKTIFVHDSLNED